jgi:hypothetical protein
MAAVAFPLAAIALPVALVLGVVSDLAGGLASRFTGGPRTWWRSVTGLWTESRRLVRARSRRTRPTVPEALGSASSLLGGGLAAAGALGLVPGSAALVYLALALGMAGLRLAEPPPVPAGRALVATRRAALLAEPAFVVALGALLLRWRAFDIDSIRATQTVLGPGIAIGPTLAAVAVGGAALAAVVAGSLRLGPDPEPARREGQSRGAGGWLLRTLGRWSVIGATTLVVAALVAGHRLDATAGAVPFAAAAVGAAVIIGIVAGTLRGRRAGLRLAVAAGALALAGGAVAVTLVAGVG